MVTVVYRVLTKKGKEDEFKKIARICTKCAHESKDCLYYEFFRSLTNPREFLVYYRFKTRAAQDAHIAHLQEKIGPAESKRDLPDKFLKLLDEEEVILFKLK
jgi:quinol monooxygenase YgiN